MSGSRAPLWGVLGPALLPPWPPPSPKTRHPTGAAGLAGWRDAASLSLLVSQAVALHNAREGIRPGHRRAGAGEDTQVGPTTARLLRLRGQCLLLGASQQPAASWWCHLPPVSLKISLSCAGGEGIPSCPLCRHTSTKARALCTKYPPGLKARAGSSSCSPCHTSSCSHSCACGWLSGQDQVTNACHNGTAALISKWPGVVEVHLLPPYCHMTCLSSLQVHL